MWRDYSQQSLMLCYCGSLAHDEIGAGHIIVTFLLLRGSRVTPEVVETSLPPTAQAFALNHTSNFRTSKVRVLRTIRLSVQHLAIPV